MPSLLNTNRPTSFCPGCAHERIAHSLDKAFNILKLKGEEIAIISDIGCSGLFDTFFNTHAMHGLHGRALTYATGIKMVAPHINVIVTIGDGGLGIGGTHFLAACRRNLNLTLLILNNFNFGMTGGQFSSTTPSSSKVNSGFLNQLESPMDPCKIGAAAGAPYIVKCSGYEKKLSEKISEAISYNGMAIMDIHGICTGRYTKKNKLTPLIIEENIKKISFKNGEIKSNIRNEYREKYKKIVAQNYNYSMPSPIKKEFEPLTKIRQEITFLGSAGQRIITAGELLCLASLTSGLSVNQKNDYPITVLRGHSITDIVISNKEINYAGINKPDIVIAIGREGITRREHIFKNLNPSTSIIVDSKLNIPKTKAKIISIDFKNNKIKSSDKALASLAILSKMNKIINTKMLLSAINKKFRGKNLEKTIEIINLLIA